MKYLSNERGGTKIRIAVVAAILLLIVILSATVGPTIYHKVVTPNKSSTSANSAVTSKEAPALARREVTSSSITTTSPPAPTVSGATYDIPELAAQFTLPASITGLTYQVVTLSGDKTVNSVAFSTTALTSAGCPPSKAPLGYLTYDAHNGGSQVKGAPLFYIPPTGSCASTQSQVLSAALVSIVPDGKTR